MPKIARIPCQSTAKYLFADDHGTVSRCCNHPNTAASAPSTSFSRDIRTGVPITATVASCGAFPVVSHVRAALKALAKPSKEKIEQSMPGARVRTMEGPSPEDSITPSLETLWARKNRREGPTGLICLRVDLPRAFAGWGSREAQRGQEGEGRQKATTYVPQMEHQKNGGA